jgi:glycosyltransferase involved in cell wall biosynthesis
MKIVCWSSSSLPSQTANSVSVMKMASAYSSLGHDVTVIAKKGDSCTNGIELFEYYGVKKNFEIVRRTYPEVKLGWIVWGLLMLKIVVKTKPDLVFARDSFGALLSALIGFNVFFEVHSPPHGRDKIIYNFLLHLNHVRRIVVISRALQDYLLKQYNIKENKIIVAPDAVDQSWLDMSIDKVESRRQLGYGEGDCVIGYSGSLYHGRGIELIMEIAKRHQLDKFIIIGGPDEERERFIIIAKSLGLNNLQFIGYIPNSLLPKYLFSCDILLMPYQRKLETANKGPDTSKYMSPLKMFEYMAIGKPIIASNLEIIKEILVEERNSLLVEPDNISQWCNAIEKLKSDSNLALNLGENARDDVIRFTWSERTKRILHDWPNC